MFLFSSSCWHQFKAQQVEMRPMRFDDQVDCRDGDRTEMEMVARV